jgi:hypothetical protein
MGTERTRRVLEESYFHTGNGGLTLRIVEEAMVWDPATLMNLPTLEPVSRSYRFEYSFSHMSAMVDGSFPLGTSDIARWLGEALARTVPLLDYQGDRYHTYDTRDPSVEGGEEAMAPASTPVQYKSESKTAHRVLARYLHACEGGCTCGGSCTGTCGGQCSGSCGGQCSGSCGKGEEHPLETVSVTAMRVADAFQSAVLGPRVDREPTALMR